MLGKHRLDEYLSETIKKDSYMIVIYKQAISFRFLEALVFLLSSRNGIFLSEALKLQAFTMSSW